MGLKDLNLALAAAEAVAVPMPIASLIRDHFLTAIARGYQELESKCEALVRSLPGQDIRP